MKRKELLAAVLLSVAVAAVLFYKTVLFGHIPFPGDLLISEYSPWKTYSYLGYNPGSYPNKAQYFDTLRQMYPWKTLVVDALKHGSIPLWNPYSFSGAPLLANFQSAVFYPLNVLYLIVQQQYAWAILVALQVYLALFFTYLYARKIGVSALGAAFSAIGYGLSSFMIVWLEYNTVGHAILWLPAILLVLENLFENISLRWFLFGIIALTAGLLAGHPQVFGYMFLFSLIYAVWKVHAKKKQQHKLVLMYFALFVFPLGIGAIQLLPGFELIQHAARSNHDYETILKTILIQPWQVVMAVIPDFFGNPASRNYYLSDTYVGKMIGIGIIPLLFATYISWQKKAYSRHTVFFLLTILITLIFSTNNPLTMVLYRLPIPFFSSSTPTLSMFLFSFSLAIVAGEGVALLFKKQFTKKSVLHFLLPGIIFFATCWVVGFLMWKAQLFGITTEHALVTVRNIVYGSSIFAITCVAIVTVYFFPKLKTAVFICLLLVCLADSFRSFQKFNPFVPHALVFPDTAIVNFLKNNAGVNRFYGYGGASIQSNFSSQYHVFSADGYDPLYPKEYGSFIHSSADGHLSETFSSKTRSDAFIAPGFGSDTFMNNTSRLRVIDTLGVKYILDRNENASTEKTFPSNRFTSVYEKDGWKVLENNLAAPRAFFADNQIVYRNVQEFEKKFFAHDLDPRKTVLVTKNIPGVTKPSQNATAQITGYDTESVSIDTVNNTSSVLVLSDTYFPGWKAYIDGEESTIYPANYAFRAVAVPAGEHTVTFKYQPTSVYIGTILTVVSLIGLGIFSLVIAIIW